MCFTFDNKHGDHRMAVQFSYDDALKLAAGSEADIADLLKLITDQVMKEEALGEQERNYTAEVVPLDTPPERDYEAEIREALS